MQAGRLFYHNGPSGLSSSVFTFPHVQLQNQNRVGALY